MASILALRTNEFGTVTRTQFERLAAAGLDMVVAADERDGEIDTGSFRKISLTEQTVRDLGLPCHPKMGWLCGDYFACLIVAAIPEADFIWLVEPDVRVHFANPADFFSTFAHDDADLLAARIDVAPSAWHWTERMAPYGTPVYRTLFAAVRLSRRAILRILDERRKLPDSIPPDRYPNDESFAATIIANAGLSCASFDTFGRFTTPSSFRFFEPVSGTVFDQTEPDGLLHHPVVYGKQYLRKAHTLCRRFPTPEHIAAMTEGVAIELGPEAAALFAAKAATYIPEATGESPD